jgi:hypothetical protein
MSGSDSGAVRNVVPPTARTASGGFALVNGTPTILSVTAPNDGQVHQYFVSAALNVTVNEVGGLLQLFYTAGGQVYQPGVVGGSSVIGTYPFSLVVPADPNTTVQIRQTSALTAGTATLIAAISGG